MEDYRTTFRILTAKPKGGDLLSQFKEPEHIHNFSMK